MTEKLSKNDMREAIAMVYGELMRGEEEEDIPENLGWSTEKYNLVKAELLESKASELRNMPREHFYVQYLIEQRQTMRAINDMLSGLDEKKMYNAMVGALRLRSEISDKVVDKGMAFGIIKKEPERKEVFNGMLIANLTDKEFQQMIADQNAKLASLMKRFGGLDIMSMEVGEIHYGPSAETNEEIIIDAELAALEKEGEESASSTNKKKKKKKGKVKK